MLARQQPAPTQCPHCLDDGIDAPGAACVLCGKRETDPRCSRCGDTGSYETVDSRALYSPYVEVKCACVRRAA